jgi:hypothetical protein
LKKSILFFMLFCFSPVLASQDTVKWNIEKSTHFVVYYKNAPEDFIKELIDKSEGYYDKIASDLGFTRYDFWLWDNRAKIYIHDNAMDYQSATGEPKWSGGSAMPRSKIIHTFPYAQGFFEKILPHEMGHIIFREFVGFDNPAVPLWLEEGVASYQEKSTYSMADAFVRNAIEKGNFITLEKLYNFNPQLTPSDNLVQLFYTESFSVVDFLIKEFGKDKFVSFCQALRDKKDLARAVAANYPFSNIQELDQAWQKYLKH